MHTDTTLTCVRLDELNCYLTCRLPFGCQRMQGEVLVHCKVLAMGSFAMLAANHSLRKRRPLSAWMLMQRYWVGFKEDRREVDIFQDRDGQFAISSEIHECSRDGCNYLKTYNRWVSQGILCRFHPKNLSEQMDVLLQNVSKCLENAFFTGNSFNLNQLEG